MGGKYIEQFLEKTFCCAKPIILDNNCIERGCRSRSRCRSSWLQAIRFVTRWGIGISCAMWVLTVVVVIIIEQRTNFPMEIVFVTGSGSGSFCESSFASSLRNGKFHYQRTGDHNKRRRRAPSTNNDDDWFGYFVIDIYWNSVSVHML